MTPCVGDSAELLLRMEGTFDVPAAWRVRDQVAKAPKSARVIVDFSRVPHCHEFALAVLFTALATLQRGVEMRGLSKHHLTLLRYLGFNDQRVSSAGASDLEIASTAA